MKDKRATKGNLTQDFSYLGKNLQIIFIKGEPWFIANQVCEILDLSNSRDALERVDKDDKGVGISDTLGGKQNVSIINESGLYSLVMTSTKTEAKKFKKWITSEVLPSIRKTGKYGVDLSNLSEDDRRIVIRSHIKQENKILATEAHSRGLAQNTNDEKKNNLEYAHFHNAGYKGLYGGLTKKEIAIKKGLNPKESILDHMGEEELAANYFRITQTKSKLQKDNIQGVSNLNTAHMSVGMTIRKTMIEISGNKIEDLLFVKNVNSLTQRVDDELETPSGKDSTGFKSLAEDLYHFTQELALFLMYISDSERITTKYLIEQLPQYIPLPADYYAQKTKNIISNRKRTTSIFYRGLATYEIVKGKKDGVMVITELGKDFVKNNLLSNGEK